MAIYSNIESYLRDQHPKLYSLMVRLGIDMGKINTIFIIPEDKSGKLYEEVKKTKDLKVYQDIANYVYAHILNINVNDEKFTGNREYTNKIRQLIYITKPDKSGKFMLYTGPSIDPKSKDAEGLECKISDALIPAKSFKGDNARPICVVDILTKGKEIKTNGKVAPTKSKFEADDVQFNTELREFYGGSEQCCTLKQNNYKALLNIGRNGFTETMCGLLMFLKKTPNSEYTVCRQVVASLATYDAFGMYLAIIQPYNTTSFLPESIYGNNDGAWNFSVARSGNYCDIVDDFVSQYCPSINDSERKKALSSIRGQLQNKQIGQQFDQVYAEYVPKIFSSNYCLTSIQKLWADELLFKCACICPSIDDMMAHVYSGKDYSSESTFRSWDYNEKFVDLDAPNGPVSFIQSEYFLKCALVQDDKCKQSMAAFSNPIDAATRAFCMINADF